MKNLLILALIIGGSAYFGAKFYLHYRVSSGLDDALVMAAPIADIQYNGVSSTMSGELSIDGITVRMSGFDDPLYIDKLTLITPGFFYLLKLDELGQSGADLEIPDTLGFAVEGVRASSSADYVRKLYSMGLEQSAAADADAAAAVCAGKYGFAPETLQQLGYDDLIMGLRIAYRQDDRSLFVDASADVEDMYELEMTVKLADRLTPELLTSGTYRPRMIEGRLEYLDQSLNERTAELCARTGLSDGEIQLAHIDALLASGLENGIEFDDYVIGPYKEFLAGKSSFILTAKPSEPINLSQIGLYKPSDVPALLNLSGEAL
jgi:hypothetical protein